MSSASLREAPVLPLPESSSTAMRARMMALVYYFVTRLEQAHSSSSAIAASTSSWSARS